MNPTTSYSAITSSPLGPIGIFVEEEQLTGLNLLPHPTPATPAPNRFCQHVLEELSHYFSDPKHRFRIKLHLEGTPFQQQVWHALSQLECGQTLTYGQLAQQLQTGARAIGQACRTNPIPIIIPCHRILAATHLGGYAGAMGGRLRQIKQWLLKHESGMKGIHQKHCHQEKNSYIT